MLGGRLLQNPTDIAVTNQLSLDRHEEGRRMGTATLATATAAAAAIPSPQSMAYALAC